MVRISHNNTTDQVSGFRSTSQTTTASVPTTSGEYCGEVDDETGGAAGVIFARFCDLLQQHSPALLQEGLDGLRRLEAERNTSFKASQARQTIWSQVVDGSATKEFEPETDNEDAQAGFSFGFDIESEDNTL